MQNKNNTWGNIVINWNQVDTELNMGTKQIDDLKDQLIKKHTASTIEVVFGLLLGFVFCTYIITEIINGLPSVMDYTLYSGILIITLVSIFIPLSIKSRGLKAKTKKSCDYLNLLFKQSQMTQKILKLSKLSCASLFFLCYGIILWLFILWLQSDHAIAKPIYALSLVGFVSLFFPSIYYWLRVQQTKTSHYQHQLQKMINECDELV